MNIDIILVSFIMAFALVTSITALKAGTTLLIHYVMGVSCMTVFFAAAYYLFHVVVK